LGALKGAVLLDSKEGGILLAIAMIREGVVAELVQHNVAPVLYIYV
jgi:hypothetical protein